MAKPNADGYCSIDGQSFIDSYSGKNGSDESLEQFTVDVNKTNGKSSSHFYCPETKHCKKKLLRTICINLTYENYLN